MAPCSLAGAYPSSERASSPGGPWRVIHGQHKHTRRTQMRRAPPTADLYFFIAGIEMNVTHCAEDIR